MSARKIVTAVVRLANGVIKTIRGVRTALEGLGQILNVLQTHGRASY
jgi:hypothetical protein